MTWWKHSKAQNRCVGTPCGTKKRCRKTATLFCICWDGTARSGGRAYCAGTGSAAGGGWALRRRVAARSALRRRNSGLFAKRPGEKSGNRCGGERDRVRAAKKTTCRARQKSFRRAPSAHIGSKKRLSAVRVLQSGKKARPTPLRSQGRASKTGTEENGAGSAASRLFPRRVKSGSGKIALDGFPGCAGAAAEQFVASAAASVQCCPDPIGIAA